MRTCSLALVGLTSLTGWGLAEWRAGWLTARVGGGGARGDVGVVGFSRPDMGDGERLNEAG